MSGITNKLISRESRKDYGEEAAEETRALSQGDEKFDGSDHEFEEARAEDNAFDVARAEEITAREHFQRERNMERYTTGIANEPKEEEEEENAEGNCKQPETNPIRGSHGWEK